MRISDLTAITTISDNHVLVINDGTPTTKKITVASLKSQLGLPSKSYKGLISQTGTNAPTLVEVFNNFGATPTTAYNSAGDYIVTLTGLLTNNKTLIKIYQNDTSDATIFKAYRVDVDSINILTFDGASTKNSLLTETVIEIEVYE